MFSFSNEQLANRYFLLKTTEGALFLSPSDVYVRSFLYLFNTLIKLYYTKSSERSSLISGPGSNSSPPEAKLDLEKAEEPEVKLPTSVGSSKRREFLKNIKPLTVWITTNWEIQEMGISDHLNCLPRNLYAGQEATVRTGHGTTDWF